MLTMLMLFLFIAPRSLLDTALFCSLGLIGGVGHYLVIRAFQLVMPRRSPRWAMRSCWAAPSWAMAIFGNFPDVWTWVGAGIIIASGISIALRERRLLAGLDSGPKPSAPAVNPRALNPSHPR
ncbi:MAG TPA: hypothetical protein VHC04_20960 [Rhodopila sp.]|nr:hypothetical protein [Rhodopila sp.]